MREVRNWIKCSFHTEKSRYGNLFSERKIGGIREGEFFVWQEEVKNVIDFYLNKHSCLKKSCENEGCDICKMLHFL